MNNKQSIKDGILSYEKEQTLEATQAALDSGSQPLKLLEAITEALNIVGDGFNCGDLFLPELIYASDCAQASIAILEKAIKERGEEVSRKGTIVLGTVQGDLHDIGKSIVAALLIANGYQVVDLGTDVPAEKMVQAVKDYNADVLGLSALLTTTAAEMENTIKKLGNEGIRSSVKVMIGGGSTNANYAKQIGADAYGETAVDAIEIVKELMS